MRSCFRQGVRPELISPVRALHPILSHLIVLACLHSVRAGEPVREPWTTSRIQGTPESPRPYVPEPVFEQSTFGQAVEIVALDGRLFVMERAGKIWSFAEDEPEPEMALFGELKENEHTFGMAFHPNWRENRSVFLTYMTENNVEGGNRLSRFRFRLSEAGVPVLDPDSEEVVLTWRSGGHHGGTIRFGPGDGLLYLGTGDATPPNPPDGLDTGQDNSDLLCCVLRIDVDRAGDGKAYSIPADNPFIGRPNVRPEIWAFGFRQPWKMSFGANGRLWVGDVGWELWEMIHLVERGGNHGWSAMEAGNPLKTGTASPLSPISPPAAAHPHTEAASITGGFEYRGTRLPGLRGAYVYGDYETGIIWALRHDEDGQLLAPEIIADTPHKISTFGVGNEGELYYIHYGEASTMYRLARNPRAGEASDFPRKLSETGLFDDVARQLPAAGVYEFEIHEPMWEDGAQARRYIALPGQSGIETEYLYRENGSYRVATTWPADAVLARTIRLGDAPVETQVLHFDGDAWAGYSYRWNANGTDADLVPAEGEEFEVSPDFWKGGSRYRIVGRAECMRCHNMWNQFTAAFDPMQLSGFSDYPREPVREAAAALGIANPLFFHQDEAKGHLAQSRGRGTLEKRARSWLHANCSHCHRRHGGGSAPLELNFDRTLSESMTLWQRPTRGDFGLTDARVIVPGEPWRSVLNYRVSSIGNGHMPPLGSREIDAHGAKLLWDWVANLPVESPSVEAEPASLTGSVSDAFWLSHRMATGEREESVIAEGLSSQNRNISALFERFRAPDERPVPAKLDHARLLTLRGDAGNGAKLLSPTGKLAACFACHRIGETGAGLLGPDLAGIGKRLNRRQLLDSLTKPSATIAPEYRVWILELKNGESLSGYLVEQTEASTSLRLATGQVQEISATEILSAKPQPVSLMPEGLLDLLVEQEAADVLAYLESLQ